MRQKPRRRDTMVRDWISPFMTFGMSRSQTTKTNQQLNPDRRLRDRRRHAGEDELVVVIVEVASRSTLEPYIGAARNEATPAV